MASNQLIERWVRPEIRAISAYHVQSSSGLIKLDAMENPYGWPQAMRDEWAELLRRTDVNRYPDPHADALREQIRQVAGIPEGMELLLGNGSDEIIQIIAMALAGPDRVLLSVEPSFVMYRMIAGFCGMRYEGVTLGADFALDLDAMLAAIETHQPAVTFLAYPNNPTGNLFKRDALMRIIEASPGLVVIDEAYEPFADDSFMDLLGEYPNLVVMRTFSKLGLAGLRLGYLAGPPAWLNEFDKVRLPYNINVLTQITTSLALRHHAELDQQTAAIRSERERLMRELAVIDGVSASPSAANFILARLPAGQAKTIHAGMKEQGVLVKNLDGSHPSLADCLRLTVGTPEENAAMLAALRSCLS